jgi:hypothetical protein
MVLMKARFYMMALVLCTFALLGCSKEKAESINLTSLVVGEWHCAPEGYDVDVYVAFDTEGSFNHYQRIGEGRYRHYVGTWFVEKDILNGTYSDGESWGSSYQVSFDGENMILTATNSSEEAIIYTKTTIPDDVKNSAIAPYAAKSVNDNANLDTRWF